MEHQDKFIGFIDILGYKSLVERAERGESISLEKITEALSDLGSEADKRDIEQYGPTICPMAQRQSNDVGFEITQVSDCVVVSTEISPAGAITLINHCWVAVFKLLRHGLMCRGHIRRGNIFHEGQRFIGTGYQEAYQREKGVSVFKRYQDDLGTPFVEIDSSVTDYVHRLEDNCVREMFAWFVEESGSVCALFPFKRLVSSFSVGPNFNASKQKKQMEIIRTSIHKLKDGLHLYVDKSNQSAVRKLEHYESGLDEQLRMCERIDEMIARLDSPYPTGRL